MLSVVGIEPCGPRKRAQRIRLSNDRVVITSKSVVKALTISSGTCIEFSYGQLIEEIRNHELSCAKERVNYLCLAREYSEHEIEQRLQWDGFGEKCVGECMKYARSCGLVSDARYTENFVYSRLNRGYGLKYISNKLRQKGIVDDELALKVDSICNSYDIDMPNKALSLLRCIDVTTNKGYQKGVRRLRARGYEYSVINFALNQRKEELTLFNENQCE